jgi:hypothetical protein
MASMKPNPHQDVAAKDCGLTTSPDIPAIDRDLGKLKGLLVLIVPLSFALWPVRSILIVLVLHGVVGYWQGIRLVSLKPAKLSNGELVPPLIDAASGFLTLLVALCIVYHSVAALNRWLIRMGLLSPPRPSKVPGRWGWSVFWPSLAGLVLCVGLAIVGPGFIQHVFMFFAAAAALFAVVSALQIRHEHRA